VKFVAHLYKIFISVFYSRGVFILMKLGLSEPFLEEEINQLMVGKMSINSLTGHSQGILLRDDKRLSIVTGATSEGVSNYHG
jgi:hypothetical protein